MESAVTDALTDIDLPRFSRQIGVTGLGQVGSGDAGPRPVGVLRPFRGVLAGGVSQRRVGGTSPQLAYLTLASLVDHGLRDRRAEAGQHDGFGRSAATGTVVRRPGDESKEVESVERDSDDTAEEPTVWELLRTTGPESADEASETSERAGLDGVSRDVSTASTLSRTVRPLNERDAPDETSGPVDAPGWTGETGVGGVDSGQPSRTVVDRSDRSPDGVETTGSDTGDSEPTGSDEPTVRDRLRDAAPEPSTTTADRVGGTEPVGTVVDRAVFPYGRGTAESDAGETIGLRTRDAFDTGTRETVDNTTESPAGQPRMTVVHQHDPAGEGEQQPRRRTASTGEGSPAREQSAGAWSAESPRRPGLTVRQPQATGQRSAAEPSDLHDGRPAGRTEPRSGAESMSTPPTVIANDGSVNDRVLDRLYAELRRKERIERDREGR